MTIQAGQTMLHYRMIEKIGEGGMGVVWKAMDTTLDREVAIKILPEALVGDTERLVRFEREAKLLASLNHPKIAGIYGIHEAPSSAPFLAMELIEGEDLAQRLSRGALPRDEALDIALQIAQAFEAAHQAGVIHRDLKPANVKRTPGGQVKVLDFGLAKAMGPEPSSGGQNVSLSPTMTSAGTIAGVILGTAAYMSPEQARGRPLDKRTDIWSFGVLLYELLTGDNPFRGNTVADSVGAIMHRDPDLEALPPGTPAAIRRLLRRCLTRERSQRLHDIADVRIELEEAIARPDVEPSAVPMQTAVPPSKLPWIALAVLVPVAALGAWWIGTWREPPAPEPARQFKLVPDQEVDEVHLSPDGTRLAYRIGNQVLIRSLDSLDSRVVSQGDEALTAEVFWSPDSRSLGLLKQGTDIQRIDLDGGAPTVLASLGSFVTYPAWGDDGYIYFAKFQSGIHRLPDSGGAAEQVLPPYPGMVDYHALEVLPDGRGFVTIPHLEEGEYHKIILERPGQEARVLFDCDSLIAGLRYSETGHLFYQREENPRGLWALPFSLARLEVTGAPFLVVADLDEASFSGAGDMAYVQAGIQTGRRRQQLVWADRTGKIVERLDMPLYETSNVVASPDGSQLAVVARGIERPSTGKPNLWVIDLVRGTSTKLMEGGISQGILIWNADGSRIAFLRESKTPGGKEALVSVRADGTGDPEVVLEADISFFATLTPDWSLATFMTGSMGEERGFRISTQVPGEPSTLKTLVDGPYQDIMPAIHPDGNWVAYLSGDIPDMNLFVHRFPEGERQWIVSSESAMSPFWSADGSRLYYLDQAPGGKSARLFEIEFDGTGAAPALGTPVEIELSATEAPIQNRMGIDPDGRFMYVINEKTPEGEEQPDTHGIVLVENWLSRFAD